jgi:predicted GNAT family N-acyltransferase
MTELKFKKVKSKSEMEISFRIRNLVFCDEQKISKEIEFDNLDHLCEHFLVYKEETPIATGRVRLKDNYSYKIERVAVLSNYRRLKVGSFLMREIIKIFSGLKDTKIILHSQLAVQKFYKNLNFSPYGEQFLEDGIPHIAMVFNK